MATIPLIEIERVVQAALIRHGAAGFAATEVARAVARAEAFGNRICGLYYLESYCKQLQTGRVKGDVTPVISTPRPGTVVVDAAFGFAQPAFAYGLAPAVDAARRLGVASLAITHAHTCTSLGYFTEMIADEGLIAVGFTNASPIVAPPGGKSRVIGTNPIAFSVPDGAGGLALHMDQSTSAVALGKITMAKAAGEAIPLGWAVDADGHPTTDPEAALSGALVSSGGYKGWGFGLMAEIFAAALTGGVLSYQVKPLKTPDGPPHDLGQYYLLIDPGVSDVFDSRMADLANAVAADAGARMPGQGRIAADPAQLDPAAWAQARTLAGEP
ncbi:MAG: Ldh family oxidoreductase [Pseudomonadota bacterium]